MQSQSRAKYHWACLGLLWRLGPLAWLQLQNGIILARCWWGDQGPEQSLMCSTRIAWAAIEQSLQSCLGSFILSFETAALIPHPHPNLRPSPTTVFQIYGSRRGSWASRECSWRHVYTVICSVQNDWLFGKACRMDGYSCPRRLFERKEGIALAHARTPRPTCNHSPARMGCCVRIECSCCRCDIQRLHSVEGDRLEIRRTS